MNALTWTLLAVLTAGVVALALTGRATRRRLRATTARVERLEDQLRTVDRASRDAVATARATETRLRNAPGAPHPDSPRVVLEPLTGRLVKAVALGAGARRAVTRLTRGPRDPQP
ncbi:MAG TPA: hypothetical protein VLV81_14835 [Acidimicrobiia bacterium]|nr:hypothetical protein [Acidimicrobiia bacterium]